MFLLRASLQTELLCTTSSGQSHTHYQSPRSSTLYPQIMAGRSINRDGGVEDGQFFHPLMSPRQAKRPVGRTVEMYLNVLSKIAHWPIILLELKYIIASARNAAAIAKGMVEMRSIVFDSREERARWRQGPRCLRCLKLRMVGGLGGLMMTPRRSSGCGACIPELTTRRHRGRSQAPWTVVMLRQPS